MFLKDKANNRERSDVVIAQALNPANHLVYLKTEQSHQSIVQCD